MKADQRGNVAILAAMMIVALLGMAAISVDVGTAIVEQQRLANAVDAAALAGASALDESADEVRRLAEVYAEKNGVPSVEVETDETHRRVTVRAEQEVQLHFARVLGFSSWNVAAKAAAQSGELVGGNGFAPLGVVNQNFQYGELYTLKYGPGSGENGNYGALALGGTGADHYRANLQNGYPGWLSVGMTVETEPGNMAGPTRQAIMDRLNDPSCSGWEDATESCRRVLYLPIIDSLDVQGRGEVTIVGFAAFYIEEMRGSTLVGRFLRLGYPGELGDSPIGYGAEAVKLVE